MTRLGNMKYLFFLLMLCQFSIHSQLEKLTKLTVRGHCLSPVKHLYLKEEKSRKVEAELLEEIVKEVNWRINLNNIVGLIIFLITFQCQSQGICLVVAQYLEEKEKNCPRPSIRVTANRLLSAKDLEDTYKTIEKISGQVL